MTKNNWPRDLALKLYILSVTGGASETLTAAALTGNIGIQLKTLIESFAKSTIVPSR